MRSFSRRSTALWLVLCVTGSVLLADDSKISPDLQPLLANPSNSIDVIVQYNTPPQSSGGLLGGLVGGVLNLVGGVVNAVFSLIPAVSATVQPAGLIAISNQSNVAYISLDRSLSASLDYSAGAVNAPQDLDFRMGRARGGVAVIDSGIFAHP